MDQLLVTLTAALELKQSLSYLDLGVIISSAGLVVVTGFNLFSSSESVIPKSENKKEKAVLHSQKAVEVTWENRLFKGLSQTRADIWGKIGKLLGSAELSQDVIDQLEETLFSSDLSPRIVEELIDHIKSIHRPEVEGTNDYLKEIKTFLKSKMSDAQAKVNTDLYKYDEKKLADILFMYGELRNARALASTIVEAREEKEIETSFQLKEVLKKHLPNAKEHKILAQIFQAIRIEVNQELEVLKEFLEQMPQLLNSEGRLSVISYHSL